MNVNRLNRREFDKLAGAAFLLAFLKMLGISLTFLAASGCSPKETDPRSELISPLFVTANGMPTWPNPAMGKNIDALLTKIPKLTAQLEPDLTEDKIPPGVAKIEVTNTVTTVIRDRDSLDRAVVVVPSQGEVQYYPHTNQTIGEETKSVNINRASGDAQEATVKKLNFYNDGELSTNNEELIEVEQKNTSGQARPVSFPGCQGFLRAAMRGELNPQKFSRSPLHMARVGLAALKNILFVTERKGQVVFENAAGYKNGPAILSILQDGVDESALVASRLDNLSSISLQAREPFKDQFPSLETEFMSNVYRLPGELPFVYLIRESRVNKKGKTETRTRMVTLYSDSHTVEKQIYPTEDSDPDIKDFTSRDELPESVSRALKTNQDGWEATSIQESAGRLYWVGDEYRVGAELTDNRALLEGGGFFEKALNQDYVNLPSHDDLPNPDNYATDLTSWYQTMQTNGTLEVGPAGLDIPEMLTKLLWGVRSPFDSDLEKIFNEQKYRFPLGSDTPAVEVGSSAGTLAVVLKSGALAAKMDKGLSESQINQFVGQLHRSDLIPVWKIIAANVQGIQGEVPFIRIGSEICQALDVPFDQSFFTFISGKALSKLRKLAGVLDEIYATYPLMDDTYRIKLALPDENQRQTSRRTIAWAIESAT